MKTSDLAEILARWVLEHDLDHPQRVRIAAGVKNHHHFTAFRFICTRAHVSGRILEQILEVRTLTTKLSVADDCLTAIGAGTSIGTPSMPVYANPEWSKRRVLRELQRRGCEVDAIFWLWEDGEPV